MYLLLKMVIFHCHVSFQGGKMYIYHTPPIFTIHHLLNHHDLQPTLHDSDLQKNHLRNNRQGSTRLRVEKLHKTSGNGRGKKSIQSGTPSPGFLKTILRSNKGTIHCKACGNHRKWSTKGRKMWPRIIHPKSLKDFLIHPKMNGTLPTDPSVSCDRSIRYSGLGVRL